MLLETKERERKKKVDTFTGKEGRGENGGTLRARKRSLIPHREDKLS